MKLLLTSSGITNASLAKSLLEMVGKPISEATIVFIPTAANVCDEDKGWLVRDLNNFKNLNPGALDIVDIAALKRDIWEPRIKSASVLVFGGGNSFHLMYHLRKSGLAELLPELLKTRIYVGISAGSIVTAKNLMSTNQSNRVFAKENNEYEGEDGLGLVDFHVRPHFNSPDFPHAGAERIEKMAETTADTIYAIDDESAVKVVGGKIEIISEGRWLRYN